MCACAYTWARTYLQHGILEPLRARGGGRGQSAEDVQVGLDSVQVGEDGGGLGQTVPHGHAHLLLQTLLQGLAPRPHGGRRSHGDTGGGGVARV